MEEVLAEEEEWVLALEEARPPGLISVEVEEVCQDAVTFSVVPERRQPGRINSLPIPLMQESQTLPVTHHLPRK